MKNNVLVKSDYVLERYHISKPTLWRWRKKNPELQFPSPVTTINGRPYWTPEQLDEWETSRA